MTYEQNYLAHFGIKGQKWGVRRFQNADGSLTPEGKERYNNGSDDDDAAWEAEHKRQYDSDMKKFNQIMSQPNGKNRDQALTNYLKEHSDQDTYDTMVDRMQEKSGDLLSGKAVSKANRSANDAYWKALEDQQNIEKRIEAEARRAHRINYDKQRQAAKQMKANSSELKAANEKTEKAFTDYCKTVLKDMGLPINEKTLDYIRGIIFWN